MEYTLKIWRQSQQQDEGIFQDYKVKDISEDMSFLEMLDVLNEQLLLTGEERPIAFEHDCREGICGACSLVINGVPHGAECGNTTCQLYMRHFHDGATITVEPFRAAAFPLICDLVVDRNALDRIIQSGGYISVHSGSAADANSCLISHGAAEDAFSAATCIGCGACVAACKNASAMLFVAAKAGQFSILPQGQPERLHRTVEMVRQMDKEGFGNCSNHFECEAACPKNISVSYIAQLNRDYIKATFTSKEYVRQTECKEHIE